MGFQRWGPDKPTSGGLVTGGGRIQGLSIMPVSWNDPQEMPDNKRRKRAGEKLGGGLGGAQ